MHKIFILLLLGLTCALGACSDTAETGSTEPAASEAPAMIPVAEITDPQVALNEGNRLLEANLTEQAIEAFNKAIALDPSLGEAYFKLGIAYSLVEAEAENSALAADEPTPLPGEKKAKEVKKESEKAFEKAVEAYEKHLDANPEDHLAYYNLGRALNKLNKDKEAEKALQKAVKLHPDDTEYQTELGAILIKLAEYREAIPPLKKALELDPENSRANELLSDAEAGRRRIDFATKVKEDKKPGPAKSESNSSDANANVSRTPAPTNSAPAKKPPPAANKPK